MAATADSDSVAIADYGDLALLLQLDSTSEVLAWASALRDADIPGVLDIVPASRTVLLEFDSPGQQALGRQRVGKLTVDATAAAPAAADRADIVIDVVYDGEDLDEVARLTEMSAADVIAAHTDTPWQIGFGGFAPGFAYLIGGDQRLHVPRRDEPRTRVPAGAVGLAGEFSGVYPRESPGGWQLIGRTDAVLWDVDRDDPALLTPGKSVRFRAVGN
jgi:KipI family sensor histidine kinase inhibitor